ncbi:hypothetical protein TDB9533_03467 [Thalassocella blandensis]|nr:hypothetical protein TDB9533_03467 [Thalassocella blandensis]
MNHLHLLSYDQWDAIADAYIPSLLLFSVATLISQHKRVKNQDWRTGLQHGGILLVGAAFVYCCMWLDSVFGVWRAMGGDFSTHTALSLWCILFLVWQVHNGWNKILLLTSWLLYLVLMYLQRYHSIFDMLSTSLWIFSCTAPLLYIYSGQRQHKKALPC